MVVKNHHVNYHCTLPKFQTGATLLVLMLIFIVGSSYFLVTKLNTNLTLSQRSEETGIALNMAKQALIGYAVSYPEKVNAKKGPGYLPCPDRDNNGNAEGGCALDGEINKTTGRLPFKTLELSELRDGSGARLWYALSDKYRNFFGFTPLNSDTTGDLTIDNVDDIVAVIIAPGKPLNHQNRANDDTDDVPDYLKNINDVTNYLEDDNSDFDVGFVTNADVDFNDRLVVITRHELMQAVEKRVLGEVKQALLNYQTQYGAFPWLSPFADPASSPYRGQIATFEGHIPFHWSDDPNALEKNGSIVGRNPFLTKVAVSWRNITMAETTVSPIVAGFYVIKEACLNDIADCDEDGFFPEMDSLQSSNAIECVWSDEEIIEATTEKTTKGIAKNTAKCSPFSVTLPPQPYTPHPSICSAGGTITRTYTIAFPSFTGTATINKPTVGFTRLRDASLTATSPDHLPVQEQAIQIADTYSGELADLEDPSQCRSVTGMQIGSGTSTFHAETQGTIAINDMQYDLDIDANELPAWFVVNHWHRLIYLAYASGESLPGDTSDTHPADGIPDNACKILGHACLVLHSLGASSDDKRAIVMVAGRALAGSRPSANIADYFEEKNAIPQDGNFWQAKTTKIFNDQIKVISTSP